MATKKVIYVPERLSRRLDAVKGLNVSALCQRALEDELGQRLAALEALVVGVSGALSELREGGRAGESDLDQSPTPAQRPRARSGSRSTVAR